MSGLGSIQNPLGCEVCSFDIFDTLLYRRSGPPETVFFAMERGWLTRFGQPAPAGFARIRTGAEGRVRRWMGMDCPTIQDIYREVCFFTEGVCPSADEMIAFELETEADSLTPFAPGVESVRTAREEGRRIVFVSDMYLPGCFLKSLLRTHDILHEGDTLFVSADAGVSKASGAMFRHVQMSLGMPASAIFHVGDSDQVDVRRASEQGWRAARLDGAALSRREGLLWHLANTRSILDPRVAGAARTARISAEADGVSDRAALSLGSAVAGPLIVAYARWILQQARCLGLSELFFLSRDGQVVFEVCRILATDSDPKLIYLHGSRQVWAFHALQARPTEERADFFADVLAHSSDSLSDCLTLLDLDGHQGLEDWAARIGRELAGRLNRDHRRRFYQSLAGDPIASVILEAKLRDNAELYLDYLRGLPVNTEASAGIVDIGWSGRWTGLLGNMFEKAYGRQPVGFQMGRFGKINERNDGDLRCLLFDQIEGLGITDVPGWFVPLVETFCGADHGRVKRMKRTSAGVEPVESASKFSGLQEGSFVAFRAGVTGFAREWARLAGAANLGERAALVEVCRGLWEFPSPPEAAFIARVDVGMAPTADCDRSLLRPYRSGDLAKLLSKTQLPGFEPHWWHHGALAVTPLPLRLAMACSQNLIKAGKSLVRRDGCWRILKHDGGLKHSLKRLRWLIRPNC